MTQSEQKENEVPTKPEATFPELKPTNIAISKKINSSLISLPHGGYVIQTSIGNILYGASPLALIDILSSGIECPHYIILSTCGVSTCFGMHMNNIEPILYYNFVIKSKKTALIARKEIIDEIQQIFE